MLLLSISGPDGKEYYKLYSDFKKQKKLKDELLSKYPEGIMIEITERGKVIDTCRLEDLFEK